nr:pyridoxine 5'-phosphate synthase [Actinomycetota bacterium]NIY07520.1 pyridoxine 5'-phosphate synthase [Gemmatimonadota bacterium]NIU18164.1 pyridoxine 5'-phosphate synthase [Actinomycetota bacterium]NIU69504.1 pyridoxine 5'-phosphate synthase [Actinomycetota bacterium]NIV54661.1 pyridoxine 5'-phosphate synthase [Actinomycetota bacterium]
MTRLSVNLNKIALLRNSRGRDYPSVVGFARRAIACGVHGITVHPRPDQRHIRFQDVADLGAVLAAHPDVEFNIEGNPTDEFLDLVLAARPQQCTLVPDDP